MEKLQILLVPHREVVITGNITGWIPSTHTWIVDVSCFRDQSAFAHQTLTLSIRLPVSTLCRALNQTIPLPDRFPSLR
jgi:hypothetical protein